MNLIDKILLLGDYESPEDVHSGGWAKAELSLRAGIRGAPPLYVWYHVGKTAVCRALLNPSWFGSLLLRAT